jgi:hypothetical protein
MKRAIYGILVALAIATLAAMFSVVWLVWFVLTMVSVGIFRWKALPETGRRLFALVLVLLLFSTMWFVGAVPTHFDRSAAESRLPLVASRVSAPPAAYLSADAAPPLDDLGQARLEFRREIFRLRAQSNSVERALSLKATADKAIDYGHNIKLEIKDLLDAKAALVGALSGRKLESIQQLDETKTALNSFLRESEERLAEQKTVADVRRQLTDFRLQSPKKSVDDVNDSMLRLEAALNRIGKEFIGTELKMDALNRVKLQESANTLVRDEVISLSSRTFPLRKIDASEWLLARDPDAITQKLLVYFEDAESAAKTPDDPREISVSPGITKVTLIKRTVVPARLTDLPTNLRLFTFQYFLLKWPTAFPAKLRLTMDLSKSNLGDAYPYAIDTLADAPIRQIRLPADSLFSASVEFKPRKEGGDDVLEATSALMPSYFLTHNYVWVELMPNNILFRNNAVQQWKQYLFPENLFAALSVMVLAAIMAFVIA